MLGIVFTALAVLSLLFGIITGNGEALLGAALSGSSDAVSLFLNIAGIMGLWSGLFRVAEASGWTQKAAVHLRPLTKLLFRDVTDGQTLSLISINLIGNIIGIGNAATPAGLAAIKRMGEASGGKQTRSAATLCVLNSASVQLIPTTILSLRASAGSAAPAEILPCVWVASFGAALIGIVCVRLFYGRGK